MKKLALWIADVYNAGQMMTLFSRFSLVSALLLLLAQPLLTSCQQKPYPVFFLTEKDSAEVSSGPVIKHGPHYYTKQPILTLDNVEKYRSFLMPDGSYGVELFVKNEYHTRLYNGTVASVGRRMLPVVNGYAFTPMKIDRPISDGEVVIWGGLNGYDLRMISRTVKPINAELEKKRYAWDNPRTRSGMPQIRELEQAPTTPSAPEPSVSPQVAPKPKPAPKPVPEPSPEPRAEPEKTENKPGPFIWSVRPEGT